MNRKLLRGLSYDDTVIVTYTNDWILKGVSAPVFFREINAKRAVQTISYHSRLRLNKLGFVLQAYNLVPYLTVKEQFRAIVSTPNDHFSAVTAGSAYRAVVTY